MNGRLETKDFIQLVGDEILKEINKETTQDNKYGIAFHDVEVIPVWLCKTIQNHKGMFIVKSNGLVLEYFIEATYNGDEQELYLDFYRKDFKRIIKCKSEERFE